MTTHRHALRESGSNLKASSGWFAMRIRGYRVFFCSLEDRERPHIHVVQGDRYAKFSCQATQTELARALGKSRRIIGKYIAELKGKGICFMNGAKNQHARPP